MKRRPRPKGISLKAVFGLGNPGLIYALTRHNVGFEVIDLYRKVHHLRKKGRIEGSALVYQHKNLFLVKPMAFMNESGRAVRAVLSQHSVGPSDALIVYDDLDLPLGRIRILARGGAGTHKGMRSILDALDTEEIPRLRVGIDVAERSQSGHDFVLDRFTPREWETLVPAMKRAVDAISLFRCTDIGAVMTQFNRRGNAVVDETTRRILY